MSISDRKGKRNKRDSKVSPVFIPRVFNLYELLYLATAFSWFASHKPRWLTNTVLLVPVELIARMAEAFKSPHSVLTAVLTTTIVHAAFIYIWGGKEKAIGGCCLLCSLCAERSRVPLNLSCVQTHLRSGPVHTRCSLCCRDTENHQGSSHMCDHMSARKNTRLYL